MAQATGKLRLANVETKLGPDVMLLRHMAGQEELGRMFEYTIDLLSEKSSVKPEDLLGTNVTVGIETPDPAKPRYINGFVTQFSELGEVNMPGFPGDRAWQYRVSINPWIWFATRRSDCRVFKDQSVTDIVKTVLGRYGGVITEKLSHTYPRQKFCAQYRETDFNFVSRLLEQAGIYYYFDHANGSHKLVLADSVSAHTVSPLCPRAKFVLDETLHTGGDEDYLNGWATTTSVQSGKYLHTDYNFYAARTVEGAAAKPHSHSFGDLEIFDYPSEGLDITGADLGNDRTADYASVRMQEIDAQYRLFNGSGNLRGLSAGQRFKLADHPQRSFNEEYISIAVALSVSIGEFASGGSTIDFHMSVKTIKSDKPYRAPRVTPKPVIHGAQTALVVGSSEIDTDEHGRVQVNFYWDRLSHPCWVRVAQVMAGKSWGAVFLPRVGQEVVVEFLEGDPDRPIITGVVYNGTAKPPYTLPDEKTKSTLKTNSVGGGGFNEIRFEDKAGSEQIFIHGQKQLDLRVKEDRYEYIGKTDHLVVKQDRMELIEKDLNIEVKGDLKEKVTGTVSLKADQNLQQKVGMKAALDAGQEIHIKAGMNLILEAGVQISLKVGGSFIDIGPAGVFIKGPMVFINSGGAAGSGSGASPDAPKKANDADDGKPGSKDPTPPAKQPPPAQTYSLQASVLRQAAQTGAPLCEI